MKIIVAGAFEYQMYQEALAYGLTQCGAQVICLQLKENRPYDLLLAYNNGELLEKKVAECSPDIVFLYRVENIYPIFIKRLKAKFPSIFFAQYHNDDPFRKSIKRYIKSWHYLHYIQYTDLTYVYRPVNLNEATEWGAKQVKLFMSHYYSKTDLRDMTPSDCLNKNGRIVFIGHWEDDGRMDYICECFKQGYDIHIYGPNYWKDIFNKYQLPQENLHSVVRGKDYINVLHNASIALAFFSKSNRDEYTRRCFEIPMAGTALLQPATTITQEIFTDGYDTILYTSIKDFVKKINYYLMHKEELSDIAFHGYTLIKNGPFSEKARAEMVLNDYDVFKQRLI